MVPSRPSSGLTAGPGGRASGAGNKGTGRSGRKGGGPAGGSQRLRRCLRRRQTRKKSTRKAIPIPTARSAHPEDESEVSVGAVPDAPPLPG